MAPRKRQYRNEAERRRAYEERLKAAGKRRICLFLDEDVIEALDRLAIGAEGGDRASVVSELVEKAERANQGKTKR